MLILPYPPYALVVVDHRLSGAHFPAIRQTDAPYVLALLPVQIRTKLGVELARRIMADERRCGARMAAMSCVSDDEYDVALASGMVGAHHHRKIMVDSIYNMADRLIDVLAGLHTETIG